jgi:hypothetical protein
MKKAEGNGWWAPLREPWLEKTALREPTLCGATCYQQSTGTDCPIVKFRLMILIFIKELFCDNV